MNDGDEIKDRLTDQLEVIMDRYWPGWIKHGNTGHMAPKGKTKTSSFQVELAGAKRGRWYRFSQSIGGGPIELLFYGEFNRIPVKGSRDDWREAFTFAREFLGIARAVRHENEAVKAQRERERAVREEQRLRAEAKEEEAERKRLLARQETAQDIAANCRPIAGTLAERYLVGRGLPPLASLPCPLDEWLGFHPGLEHELSAEWDESGRKIKAGPIYPCLVGYVRDVGGGVTGVWRVFLDPATGGKAPVDKAKLGKGTMMGGAVRIGGSGPRIGVCEGIETALAAWCLVKFRYPVWSMLSTAGVAGFEPPLDVERLDCFPDGDYAVWERGVLSEPPGLTAARKLRDRLAPTGLKVVVNDPAIEGDCLDLWNTLNAHEKA